MNLNPGHHFRVWKNKYYASGSPLRYLRKATFELANPGASRLRSRLGKQIAADLPPNLQQHLRDLETTGYADADNEVDQTLFAELSTAAEAKLASYEPGEKKHVFFSSITTEEDLTQDSIYVRFALQPAIQKLACAYFGNSVPYLASACLLLSTGREAQGWVNSQLWHLDYSDSRMLRFWIYLNDVNAVEDGPFTYMPVAPSRQVPNTFFPKRVTDEEMAAAGLDSAACQVFGPKGRAFFIDTSRCYHLGSRLPAGRRRLVYDVTFITHKPLYDSPNGIQTNGNLSDLEKCFLTL